MKNFIRFILRTFACWYSCTPPSIWSTGEFILTDQNIVLLAAEIYFIILQVVVSRHPAVPNIWNLLTNSYGYTRNNYQYLYFSQERNIIYIWSKTSNFCTQILIISRDIKQWEWWTVSFGFVLERNHADK